MVHERLTPQALMHPARVAAAQACGTPSPGGSVLATALLAGLVLHRHDRAQFYLAAPGGRDLRGPAGGLLRVSGIDQVEAAQDVANRYPQAAGLVAGRLPSAGNAGHPAPDTTLTTLTSREGEVFQLMAKGLSNAEIAGTLVVSETTVKTHVGSVLTKLGLRDRIQAVVYAYETGIIQPGAQPQPGPRATSRSKDADLPPGEAHHRRQLHTGRPGTG